jgi:hypothetical protein
MGPLPLNLRHHLAAPLTTQSAITGLMHRGKFLGSSCGAFNLPVDFAAEHYKVDRLSEKCLSAILKRFALCLRIAIGSDHDDRDVRS